MARWRLTSEHYLMLDPPSEWEYKEVDQMTGNTARTVLKVGTYLSPKDRPYVVCHKGKGQPGDLVFLGDPTKEMEPLDDEAIALSEARRPFWADPIDSLPGTTMAERIMDGMQKAISDLAVSQKLADTKVTAYVNPAEFAALQKQVKELMEQNAALKQTQPSGRRI
jgi:hypothetical protein